MLVERQAERCAICGGRSARQVWDHDHATDLLRELLCVSCNAKEPCGGRVQPVPGASADRDPRDRDRHFGRPSLGALTAARLLEDDSSDLVAAAIEW
ncbi:endonuclease domain-containing protein [Nonomuraea sp. NPDC001023]|uniref:endonuclease domain-containing protein n=1 Tax=unclassified Nonomuraea TaxID=2593643 RepID=UPI003323C66D